MSEVLDKCGYTLIIRTSGNDRERDYRALEAMRYQRVRGLIYVPACNYENEPDFEEMASRLGDLGGPSVILDRPINRLDCDCVLSDLQQRPVAWHRSGRRSIKSGSRRSA